MMPQAQLMCVPQLYGRSYTVAFGSLKDKALPLYGNINTDNGKMSAIRVQFEITKAAAGAANTGNVSLYNINQQHRDTLKRGSIVELRAGYQGAVKLLIVGSVLTATSKRDGPNIVTTLELVDGLHANTYATIDKSFPKGTKLADILRAIAESMSAQFDARAGTAVGIPEVIFNRGYYAQGACRDVLEDLLSRVGLEAFIDNGELNIVPRRNHLQRRLITLSASTGLLGIPSINYEHVDFEALLNPDLVPGQLIALDTHNAAITSKRSGITYQNNYKIRSCVMSGDTHDTKWSVTGKAIKISERLIRGSFPAAHGFDYATATAPQESFDDYINPGAPVQSDVGIFDVHI